MNILGLDISTTTIGVALVNGAGKIILLDYVKPEGIGPLHKAINAGEKLRRMLHGAQIDVVAIERPAIMFKGGSSGQTVALLHWFGGAMAVQIWQMFNKSPIYIAPSTARKAVLGVGRFPKGSNTKREVLNGISLLLSKDDWPVGGKGAFIPECYDMADAAVIALAPVMNLSLIQCVDLSLEGT